MCSRVGKASGDSLRKSLKTIAEATVGWVEEKDKRMIVSKNY